MSITNTGEFHHEDECRQVSASCQKRKGWEHVMWSLNNARAFCCCFCCVVPCVCLHVVLSTSSPRLPPPPPPLTLTFSCCCCCCCCCCSFMTTSASLTSKGKQQQQPYPTFCITFKQTNKQSAANKQPVVLKECTCYCTNGAHRYTKVQHHPSPELVRQPAEDYRAKQPSSKDHGRSDTGQDRSVAD